MTGGCLLLLTRVACVAACLHRCKRHSGTWLWHGEQVAIVMPAWLVLSGDRR